MSTNLQTQIDRVVDTIARRYQPEKIILFGSASRGDATSDSDVDLFIVKPHRQPRHQRSVEIRSLLKDVDYDFPVDILVYTPEEVNHRLWLGDFFVKRVMKEGKVLYAKH